MSNLADLGELPRVDSAALHDPTDDLGDGIVDGSAALSGLR